MDVALQAHAPDASRDRAMAWHLVWGVLRRRNELDYLVELLSHREIAKLDAPVLAALRIGLLEMGHGRAPSHAVVNEAVQLCKIAGTARAAPLVNAILRHYDASVPLPPEVLLNHPRWLLRRWTERIGQAAAIRWAKANNKPAPTGIVARGDPRGLLEDLERAQIQVEPAIIAGKPVPRAFKLPPRMGPIHELPGYHGGSWWVQDPAAVAVADLVLPGTGALILDACAAPGGKSFRMVSRGARVVATDIVPARLEELRRNAKRLHMDLQVRPWDWLSQDRWPGARLFDAALLDAPCTGLGTLRRHPDIRWRRHPGDPARMAQKQAIMLRHVSRTVKKGGVLVYAVCSGEPEEGREVVESFVSSIEHFEIEEVLCTAPPTHDEDAFWAARMRCL